MLKITKHPAFRDYFLCVLLIAYIGVLICLASDRPDLLLFYRNTQFQTLSVTAVLILATTYIYLFATGILCCFYRPYPIITDDSKLPTCTVIVPAYNEGEHVEITLQSLLKSDYPRDKFEIIVINDGSEDDTWDYIKRGAEAAPKGLVTAINLPLNCGKKNALYIGTKKASGEIVVTVDSDSLVSPHTVRALVSPMNTDPQIGAVAGALRVKHYEQHVIAALFDVLMVFGCEFLRAAQSVTGLALCTPGALSCYRRKALLPVLDEWIRQTFLGKPAHIGEDRALATLVLRSNYKIVHQRPAIAQTCVPDNIPGVWKMLLRWNRGDLRENLRMTKFAFKNFPQWNVRSWVLLAYWVALMQNLTLPFLFVPSYIFMIFFGAKNPVVFLAAHSLLSLVWALIPAVIYGYYTRPRKAVWAFLYGIFCPFLLAFMTIYCILTLRDSRWMTRSVKKDKKQQTAAEEVDVPNAV